MNDTIFLNLAFGDHRYIEQQERCNASIRAIYPDANIKSWTNEYPPGSRTHRESLYGFKVRAVKWAMEQGYLKIIWLDCATVLIDKVDYWFSLIPKYGVVAAKDDNKLENFICDKMLDYFNRPNIDGWHLCGGSLYCFDMNNEVSSNVFRTWQSAESNSIFGSQFEQSHGLINKSRHDESAMSMALYMSGREPVPYDQCKYNNGPDSIIQKFHFK